MMLGIRYLLASQNVAVLMVAALLAVSLAGCDSGTGIGSGVGTIEFNRDLRPILNKNCTGCHGGVGKQSGVSFIRREEALGRGHSGRLTVVPGDPDASGLIERVESKDPNIRMPYKAPPLKNEEIALLRQWIKEGAQWQEHWAFEPPVYQAPPVLSDHSKIENEIDLFIQSKLVDEGLSAAEKTDKSRLLRRVSLDLTGLPPTEHDINTFLEDQSDNAYEKQVDRLLASPQFGEHWASMWMDLARYADTKGYTWDKYRATWPYRDWVIDAFNANKSYKDFIIEQLAGDLLPNRSIDNVIATAFHRQTTSNDEGGTDDEEFRVVSVLDRVSTTWSVINGVTMNCVQCHSHPYDPIEHEEFYQFYSFLNTTQDADKFNDQPHLKFAVDSNKRLQAFETQEKIFGIERALAKQALSVYRADEWKKLPFIEGEIDELTAVINQRDQHEVALNKIKDKTSFHYESSLKKLNQFNDEIERLGEQDFVVLGLKTGEVYETSEGLAATAVYKLKTEKVFSEDQFRTVSALRFLVKALEPDKSAHSPEAAYNLGKLNIWHVHADGSETAIRFSTMIAGNTETLPSQVPKLNEIHQERIQQSLAANEPLERGDKMGQAIGLSAAHLFNPRWSVAVLHQPIQLLQNESLRVEATYPLWAKLRRLHLATSDRGDWARLAANEARLENIAQHTALHKALSDIESILVPVMYEQDSWDHRATAVFARGNFLTKEGPLLEPGTPKLFPAFDDVEKNRLTMAQWFFKPDQPLTARVAVNRFWYSLFGRGIVETLEDFGSIGEKPTHPKLLDWLALHFQNELDWDIKALLKLIVSSHTYQQKSNLSKQLYDIDPNNTLLARGPLQRLSAEMVRDQALRASGLLSYKMGGKSVMPPQPDNIWGRKGVTIKDWDNAEGEDRYRRAIYTFIKRQYYYPSFESFDMESRELSHARRIPTNTPLQALVTLNDPVYHEAAEALAVLMLQYSEVSDPPNAMELAIQMGFRRVISRDATVTEMQSLKMALNHALVEVGKEQSLRAWTALASILLNLDVALTR